MPGRTVRYLPGLLVGAALVTAGCTDTSGDSSAGCEPSRIPAHDSTTLIIEGDPWSGYAPFRDPDLLDESGYTSHYVEQLCQDVRAVDLTTGKADIIVTTLDQYLLNEPEGTVVGVIDQSIGADALALNTAQHPYLQSLDNLPQLVEEYRDHDDKPVLVYTGNSPSEMLLNELANTTEELQLADFELVSVDQSVTALSMLQNEEAQLAVIWEPETSRARTEGYTIALSSADVPDSIVDVIVASEVLIQRDRAAVDAVVRSFYTTMDRYLADPDELERFIAEDGALDAADARSVIEGIKLYGSTDADAFMNQPVFPLDRPQLDQSVEAIGSVLALLHPDIEVQAAKVDGSYVAALAGRSSP